MKKQYFVVAMPNYEFGFHLHVREKRTSECVDIMPIVNKHYGDVAAIAAELSPCAYSSKASARRATAFCAVLSLRELLALVNILELPHFESDRERQIGAHCVFNFLWGGVNAG